jgi:hypothetical protein
MPAIYNQALDGLMGRERGSCCGWINMGGNIGWRWVCGPFMCEGGGTSVYGGGAMMGTAAPITNNVIQLPYCDEVSFMDEVKTFFNTQPVIAWGGTAVIAYLLLFK